MSETIRKVKAAMNILRVLGIGLVFGIVAPAHAGASCERQELKWDNQFKTMRMTCVGPKVVIPSETLDPRPDEVDKTLSAESDVSLKKVGGTFVVPVEINGAITLDFTLDSGAADVSVPADVFSTLTRTGTIRDTDIIGKQTYILADGSETKSTTFTIRSLKVGNNR